MIAFLRTSLVCMVALLLNSISLAANVDNFYRNYWHPKFHGERLNYCTYDGTACGLKLAKRYCRMMGYADADQQIIDHNVGLTNFMDCRARCRGWRCNGFKTIRCVSKMTHRPPRSYHYRFRKFVYPRFNQYRVAWCYDGERGCGQRAAHSFCRQLGYLTARKYQLQPQVAATKAIGNQKLCFGQHCNAFSYISCYR